MLSFLICTTILPSPNARLLSINAVPFDNPPYFNLKLFQLASPEITYVEMTYGGKLALISYSDFLVASAIAVTPNGYFPPKEHSYANSCHARRVPPYNSYGARQEVWPED